MTTNGVGIAVKRRGTTAWLDLAGTKARSGCTRRVARGALVDGQKKQIEEEEWHH